MSVILSDVDGVLNVNGEPVPWIGFLFDALRAEGHSLILWSARGADHAERWGNRLALWPFSAASKSQTPPPWHLIALQIDDSPGQRLSDSIPFLHATWRA